MHTTHYENILALANGFIVMTTRIHCYGSVDLSPWQHWFFHYASHAHSRLTKHSAIYNYSAIQYLFTTGKILIHHRKPCSTEYPSGSIGLLTDSDIKSHISHIYFMRIPYNACPMIQDFPTKPLPSVWNRPPFPVLRFHRIKSLPTETLYSCKNKNDDRRRKDTRPSHI